jgi:hypothetical protein
MAPLAMLVRVLLVACVCPGSVRVMQLIAATLCQNVSRRIVTATWGVSLRITRCHVMTMTYVRLMTHAWVVSVSAWQLIARTATSARMTRVRMECVNTQTPLPYALKVCLGCPPLTLPTRPLSSLVHLYIRAPT